MFTNGLSPTWANTVGYVPQNVALFSGSVAENIARMGNAKENEPAIVEAAHHARIHNMVL